MMSRWISLILKCGIVWLGVCLEPAGADDAEFIDPSTTIVTVDGVPLSAGLILVPAGKDLEQWWAGEGRDSETQERVRKELATYSEAAVDTELLRAMFSKTRELAGTADDQVIRPTLEKYIPSLQHEAGQEINTKSWLKKSPGADRYVSAWLNAEAEVEFMTRALCQSWLEKADQTQTVRAHWAAHREEYLVLRSTRWRQITIWSHTADEVEGLLHAGKDFATVAEKFSRDEHRINGGLVESQSPHLLIPDKVIAALQNSEPGKIVRVNTGKTIALSVLNTSQQIILLKPEKLELIPGDFHEVAQRVRLDLARLKSGELGKRVAAKRRAKSRIEWQVPIRI